MSPKYAESSDNMTTYPIMYEVIYDNEYIKNDIIFFMLLINDELGLKKHDVIPPESE